MAKARVVHSDDACSIIFEGDKSRPEPSTGVVKFPGGHVEVSRTSTGQYWAHIHVNGPVVGSRVDHTLKGYKSLGEIPDFPEADEVRHVAFLISPQKETD